ncbi:MAG: hypothetical protein HY899_02360 [Deltaproteobacteria bacterium]|nr:hypothetical protein [Deltaproteobacteria bacterium]
MRQRQGPEENHVARKNPTDVAALDCSDASVNTGSMSTVPREIDAAVAHRRVPDNAFRRARLLWWISLFFAALGACLPIGFWTPFFALYRSSMFEALEPGGVLPSALQPVCSLLLGITGGSIAGKWIAHAALARYALVGGERWARNASMAGLLTWLMTDSATSLARGAAFNVTLINWAPLLAFGLPMALAWNAFQQQPRGRLDARVSMSARCCEAVCWLGAVSGVVIALAGSSSLFAPWHDALAKAYHLDVEQTRVARRLAGFFLGPIGGSVAGQFVMLAAIAHHAIPRRRRWAIPACLASIIGWFVVDSGYGLLFGGWFNIVMLNVPTLLLTLPPLCLAARRQ